MRVLTLVPAEVRSSIKDACAHDARIHNADTFREVTELLASEAWNTFVFDPTLLNDTRRTELATLLVELGMSVLLIAPFTSEAVNAAIEVSRNIPALLYLTDADANPHHITA
jgi:hypothetical protein